MQTGEKDMTGGGRLINYDPVNRAANLCNFIEFHGNFVTDIANLYYTSVNVAQLSVESLVV